MRAYEEENVNECPLHKLQNASNKYKKIASEIILYNSMKIPESEKSRNMRYIKETGESVV